MSTALARQQHDVPKPIESQGLALRTFDEFRQVGEVLARSGYFADTRDAAQAMVKVLAGAEIGFGPIASMMGVYIINGKPSFSATLLAAAIKRSGKYNFKVLELTDDRCEIEFYEYGQALAPTSVFSTEDAIRAELLTGSNKLTWKKYPRNMRFARAITQGARWHCGDVLGGPVYMPEELGVQVDGEGEPITIEATPVKASGPVSEEIWDKVTGKDEPEPEPPSNVRPIQSKVARPIGSDPDEGWQIDQHTRITVFGLCAELEKLGVKEATWRKKMKEVTGVSSRKDLTGPQAAALMRSFAIWIADIKSVDEGDREPVGPTREELQKEIEKQIRKLVNEYAIDFHAIKNEMKKIAKKETRKELDHAESLKVRDGFDEWTQRLELEARKVAEEERAAIQAEGGGN